ncbi:hypothetical protein [Runella sp.]|uniref:hypothetical protein n=1 Tax=Runella sp. TaxID=1960881 RepID=UPI003D1068F8
MAKKRYYFKSTTPDYFLEKLSSLGIKGKIIAYQPGSPVVAEIRAYCTEEQIKQLT